MSITYRVNGNLVLIEATDELSDQEALDFQARFIADHRIHAGFRALFDASTVRSTDIDDATIDLLLEMERLDPDKFRGSKTAVVFIEPCGWTKAKEFERRARRNIIVFFSREVARVWLGIENGHGIAGDARQGHGERDSKHLTSGDVPLPRTRPPAC